MYIFRDPRQPDGAPLSWSAQARPLVALRSFFAWCAKSRRALFNPASGLVMPRQSHKLPSATLSHAEAEAVLSVPDTATVTGLRDRAVLELLYASAMRRGELVGLDLADVDLPRGWLSLRETKARWDRVVPMGERAGAWLERYLADARPHLVADEAPRAVFLATNGERLGANWLSAQVHRYIEASGVGKAGSCHLFRHSAATLMLEGGADVRYVQELLGHRSLSSTHVYTRVVPKRLAAVHRATHWQGSTTGPVVLGGRVLSVRRPRGRTSAGEEINLDSWSVFSSKDLLDQLTAERVLAGVATRRHADVSEPLGTDLDERAKGPGAARSPGAGKGPPSLPLAELMARDLSSLEVVALMVDGIEVAGQCCVASLLITADGTKVPAGVWLGDIENKTVVTALLADIVGRGLHFEDGLLVVIDGAKALAAAVAKVFVKKPLSSGVFCTRGGTSGTTCPKNCPPK